MIHFGNDKIKDIYVGSDKIKEVYYGSEKVWQSSQVGYWVHKDTGVKTYFGLEDPSITDGIMSYPSWATDCSEVQIPSEVTGLGDSCFNYCPSLTSINIPEGVTSLGELCFNGCSSLTSVTLPEGLTILGNSCFYSCSALTSINIPEGVNSIGNNCFQSCESLTSINIPEGVTILGDNCFNGCYALTSITIPENVVSLGEMCFYMCSSLVLATVLPAVPPSLGWNAFGDVHSSFNIKVNSPYVDDYKTNWSEYADIISAIPVPGYWVHKNTGVKTYFGADADFITDGIMGRPSWVTDCSEVQLPSGVTGIGSNCFTGSSSLTSITLPEGLTDLGGNCFYNCSSLTSITLPESVTSLGNACFRGCSSLDSITLPENVTDLGVNCFMSCTSLALATVLPAIPPSIGTGVFLGVHTSFIIKVRPPYVDTYKTATNWTGYASKISAI